MKEQLGFLKTFSKDEEIPFPESEEDGIIIKTFPIRNFESRKNKIVKHYEETWKAEGKSQDEIEKEKNELIKLLNECNTNPNRTWLFYRLEKKAPNKELLEKFRVHYRKGIENKELKMNLNFEVKKTKSKTHRNRRLYMMDFENTPETYNEETIQKITEAWEQVKSPLGYATFNDIVEKTGLSPQEVMSILKGWSKKDPDAVRFNINRSGALVYFKIVKETPEYLSRHPEYREEYIRKHFPDVYKRKLGKRFKVKEQIGGREVLSMGVYRIKNISEQVPDIRKRRKPWYQRDEEISAMVTEIKRWQNAGLSEDEIKEKVRRHTSYFINFDSDKFVEDVLAGKYDDYFEPGRLGSIKLSDRRLADSGGDDIEYYKKYMDETVQDFERGKPTRRGSIKTGVILSDFGEVNETIFLKRRVK